MILASLGQNDAVACYRIISPAYAGTPRSGMGAARQGGRFNRPGQEALYLSMDERLSHFHVRPTDDAGNRPASTFSYTSTRTKDRYELQVSSHEPLHG